MHKTIKTVINNLQDFQILETQLSTPLLIFFLSSMVISIFPISNLPNVLNENFLIVVLNLFDYLSFRIFSF